MFIDSNGGSDYVQEKAGGAVKIWKRMLTNVEGAKYLEYKRSNGSIAETKRAGNTCAFKKVLHFLVTKKDTQVVLAAYHIIIYYYLDGNESNQRFNPDLYHSCIDPFKGMGIACSHRLIIEIDTSGTGWEVSWIQAHQLSEIYASSEKLCQGWREHQNPSKDG